MFIPIWGVTLEVYSILMQKLVPGRRPDVYIPGQTVHAYILRFWYLVPLIKPRPLGCRSIMIVINLLSSLLPEQPLEIKL